MGTVRSGSRLNKVLVLRLDPEVADDFGSVSVVGYGRNCSTRCRRGRCCMSPSRALKSEYTVGPDVPVLANGPGDISLLKPGVAVFVIALKHEDGKLTSARLYAEKDGIKPPM